MTSTSYDCGGYPWQAEAYPESLDRKEEAARRARAERIQLELDAIAAGTLSLLYPELDEPTPDFPVKPGRDTTVVDSLEITT